MNKFSDEQIRNVVELYDLGYGARTISHLLPDMSESHIEQVLEGKTRVSITGGRIMQGRKICRAAAAKRGWERRRQMTNGN